MISGVLLISLSFIIVGGEFTKLDQEKLERSARVDHYDIYQYFQELNRTINEVCESNQKNKLIFKLNLTGFSETGTVKGVD